MQMGTSPEKRLGRLLIFLLAMAAPLSALDPSRSLDQYQTQNWQWEQGLPSNAMHALAQTEDGQILIGTAKGLVRFDGSRFTPIPVNTADVNANFPIFSLVVARDGALWIGTNHNGLIVRRGTQSRVYTTADGLPGNTVQSLYQDDRGEIWAGTTAGTCLIAQAKVRCLPTRSAPAPRMRSNVVDDNTGGVLIAVQSGLLDWKQGTVIAIQRPGTSAGEISTLFRDRNRRIWAGTTKGLFLLHLHGNLATLEARPGVVGPVDSIAEDNSGNLWISSYGHGLYRWNRNGVEHSAHSGQFIRTLLADRDGNLWIGSWSEGLTHWTDSSFIPYGVPEGLSNPFAVTVHQDPRGVLWLAAIDGGLFRFMNGHITHEGVPAPLLDESVRAIASGPNGRVWFGTARHGLYSFDGHSLGHWAGHASPVQRDIRALLVDSSGDLWVGFSPGGVARFQGLVINAKQEQAFLPGQRVHALLEPQPGVVLAGTDKGLYQVSGGLATSLPGAGSVQSLSRDSAGMIWVGLQSGGIDMLENGNLLHFSPAQGVPAATVNAVLDDERGSLWMATDRGILRLRRDQMLAVARGKLSFVESALYGRLDGMRTIECRWEAQPAAWRSSNGDLWFATANGFVRRTALTLDDDPAPEPVIEGTSVDGRIESGVTHLETQPGAREIDIDFGAIKLTDPQQLQFRYKLEGFDSDWHTETSGRTARYAALSPGRYEFLLQARSELGPWSSQSARLLLVQKPYLYQTWWARLAGIGFAAVLLWLWSHWYRGRVQGRVAAVVEERNRISREWHDSLMAGFAAIGWQLEATRDRLHKAPDEAQFLLDVARDMVRHTQTEARRIIWDLRLDLDERGTLSEALANLCRRLNETTNVKVSTELQGPEVRLPGVLSHNLLRIAQESVHNAIRHAQPNSIVVRLCYGVEVVTLCIKDDGCGFLHQETRQADEGHLGILGMTERARKLGGKLDVHSSPGAGTEVVATFSLQGKAA
jgi:signal transduction histidine kinase/ligand-binding sensor domain-containing protein